MNELESLNNIANNSLYSAGVNYDSIIHSFKIFKRYISGSTLLEMGPAEGVMTKCLKTLDIEITVIEGSELFGNQLRSAYPDINVNVGLFEDFHTDVKFDNIVLGHVLEHVKDPIQILSLARNWLNDDGRILAAVPNARSLHRQVAVDMGLLEYEDQLNESDRHHGHRRVYNPETFRRDFLSAGLKVDVFGGYWLKPISNKQIEESWSSKMVASFMRIGERYPDIAGEIYIVASTQKD